MTLLPRTTSARRHAPAGIVAQARRTRLSAGWRARLHRLREWYHLWQRVRRSRQALDQLDARNLEDIGLRRTETGYESGPSTCERDMRLTRALGRSFDLWP